MDDSKLKCHTCNGTGVCSAHNAPDVPYSQQVIGCWNCHQCMGRGCVEPLIELTKEEYKVLDKAMARAIKLISSGTLTK